MHIPYETWIASQETDTVPVFTLLMTFLNTICSLWPLPTGLSERIAWDHYSNNELTFEDLNPAYLPQSPIGSN